jgi:peroxiredoxin family protein
MATPISPIETTTDISALEARIEQLESRLEEVEASMPKDRVTMVVFSGDLDRVLAAFIIATGAMAMGQEVSMYFTFWGLNALREQRLLDGKSLPEKMMAMMTPGNTQSMGVSKMNFFGIGAKMLRFMMKDNNVETFEGLIDLAQEMGATMYSCAMSRDVMGIDQDELRIGTIEAGVGTFLADGLESRITIFV